MKRVRREHAEWRDARTIAPMLGRRTRQWGNRIRTYMYETSTRQAKRKERER